MQQKLDKNSYLWGFSNLGFGQFLFEGRKMLITKKTRHQLTRSSTPEEIQTPVGWV